MVAKIPKFYFDVQGKGQSCTIHIQFHPRAPAAMMRTQERMECKTYKLARDLN